MNVNGVVTLLAAAEAIIVAVLMAMVLGHAAWLSVRSRRYERHLARSRTILYRYLTQPPKDVLRVEREFLIRLGWTTQSAILLDLMATVDHAQKERLAALSDSIGLTERARRYARSRSWKRRLRGVRVLSGIGRHAEMVPALLHDPEVEIRAQVAEWALQSPTPEVIDALLHMIDDPAGLCRFTVQDTLIRMRGAAIAPVCRFLMGEQSTLALASALRVARGIASPASLEAALKLSHHGDPSVRSEAAAVLGAVGDASALGRLRELLRDDSTVVRAAATQALRSLEDWEAGSEIARLLGDPSWPVRRQAALALRKFGAPGRLLLESAMRGGDPFASEMARQVLDLPDSAVVMA